MNYQEFKNTILKQLQDFYGKDAAITVREVIKNNGVNYDGINIYLVDSDNKVVPVICLNVLYEYFIKEKMTIEDCIGAIVEFRESNECSEDIVENTMKIMDWSYIKDKVYPSLVSTAENQALLDEYVTETFLDLSVVYLVRFIVDGRSFGNVKISNKIFKQYGISKEELHEQALFNLSKEVYKLQDIEEVIEELLIGEKLSKPCNDIQMEQGRMYVLTNETKLYGAAGILNKNFVKEKSGGRNLYILPASIHEVIFVLEEEGISQERLDNIVSEVNATQLEVDEQLSNHSYYYDAQADEIRIKV